MRRYDRYRQRGGPTEYDYASSARLRRYASTIKDSTNLVPSYRLNYQSSYYSNTQQISCLSRYSSRETLISSYTGLSRPTRLLLTRPETRHDLRALEWRSRRTFSRDDNNNNEEVKAISRTSRVNHSLVSDAEVVPTTSAATTRLNELLAQSMVLERLLGESVAERTQRIAKNREICQKNSASDVSEQLSDAEITHTAVDQPSNTLLQATVAPTPVKHPKRRHLAIQLPNETLWEIVQFVPLKEVGKLGVVNSVFAALVAPRIQLKIQLLREQIDRTKKQLDETNEQIARRQEQIALLNGQIGQMNDRLGNMNGRLASVHSEIERSHRRIDELLLRLRKSRDATAVFDSVDEYDENSG